MKLSYYFDNGPNLEFGSCRGYAWAKILYSPRAYVLGLVYHKHDVDYTLSLHLGPLVMGFTIVL